MNSERAGAESVRNVLPRDHGQPHTLPLRLLTLIFLFYAAPCFSQIGGQNADALFHRIAAMETSTKAFNLSTSFGFPIDTIFRREFFDENHSGDGCYHTIYVAVDGKNNPIGAILAFHVNITGASAHHGFATNAVGELISAVITHDTRNLDRTLKKGAKGWHELVSLPKVQKEFRQELDFWLRKGPRKS